MLKNNLLFSIAILALLLFNRTGLADDREDTTYPNLIAIGWFQPLGSSEGNTTPLIYWSYHEEDKTSGTTFDLNYETSSLEGTWFYPLTEKSDYGFKVLGEALSEAEGMDIYANGEQLDRLRFNASSGEAQFLGRYHWRKDVTLDMAMGVRAIWFADDPKAKDNYDLPVNHLLFREMVALTWDNVFDWKKTQFKLNFENGNRDRWESWELENSSETRSSYHRYGAQVSVPHKFQDNSESKALFQIAGGRHLDILNSYRIGGMSGKISVPGYYRNEFRAAFYAKGAFEHTIYFEKDRRLICSGEWVNFKRLNREYLDSTPRHQTIGGASIGLYWGIRSLEGLPVILKYGEGINVHADSKENDRRELMVVVAAGF